MLSCHDDELDDRRVAFIYYLVPESWNEGDGGRLQLFSLDGIGTILDYFKSILKEKNVWFDYSYRFPNGNINVCPY